MVFGLHLQVRFTYNNVFRSQYAGSNTNGHYNNYYIDKSIQIELEVGGGVHHEQHGVEHNLDQHRENDVDERIDNSRNINS